jgi:hypothetical protein
MYIYDNQFIKTFYKNDIKEMVKSECTAPQQSNQTERPYVSNIIRQESNNLTINYINLMYKIFGMKDHFSANRKNR